MGTLLHVESSPRKGRSASIEVGQAFLGAYRAANPKDEIQTIDVWSLDLPEFGEEALAAKYAGLAGNPLTDEQTKTWDGIRRLAAPFLSADKMLFTLPLWNFAIPYRLKHLIDLISQKDVLFSFDDRGFGGLVRAKKSAVVYARGLDYFSASSITPEKGYDFQRPYMEMWLRFIGIEEITEIVVEKTLFGPDVDRQARDIAKRQAEAVALGF